MTRLERIAADYAEWPLTRPAEYRTQHVEDMRRLLSLVQLARQPIAGLHSNMEMHKVLQPESWTSEAEQQLMALQQWLADYNSEDET